MFFSIEDLCPLLNAGNVFPLAVDIARWSALKIEEKIDFYSKHACHELHLFLHAHDPSFFTTQIAPVISNRLDHDFIDLFLLGRDISDFACVARCSSLNVCEKIILARAIGGRTGAAVAFDVVRRCSALDVSKHEWKDDVRLNAAMSFGVFSRGLTDEIEESTDEGFSMDSVQAEKSVMKKRSAPAERSAGFHPPPPPPSHSAPFMYQAAGIVKQIAEQRWKNIPKLSVFFRELALHTASCISSGSNSPFVSPFVSTASDCALVALSFISLPLSTRAADVVRLQRRTTSSGISSLFLLASGACLRYFKDTVEISPPPETRAVIVGQHVLESVFDPAVGWKQVTVVEQGCLVGLPYTLRTIVTNTSEQDIVVNVLTQIPSSSMPLYGTLHTNVKSLSVSAFSVRVVDNWFFFPVACDATVYPAQVASTTGNCVGCAVPMPNIRVHTSVSVSADSSWPLIVTHGSEEQLLAALTSDMDLLRMRVVHILGRLAQSSALLHSVFDILRENHVCIPVVWALGLSCHIRIAAAEFLMDIVPSRIVASLVGSSVPIPVARHGSPFTVLRPSIISDSGLMTGVCDFEPVFNARTHALGDYSTIAIEAMRAQYRRIMWKVAIDPTPVRSDCIQIACAAFLHPRFACVITLKQL